MLPYTWDQVLVQKALIERDEAPRNKWGAETKAERVVVGEAPCVLAPFVEASRGRAEETATPVRTVAQIPALLIVPRDTDVAEKDWIKEIRDREGNQLVAGPFRVIGVIPYEDHLELGS